MDEACFILDAIYLIRTLIFLVLVGESYAPSVLRIPVRVSCSCAWSLHSVLASCHRRDR